MPQLFGFWSNGSFGINFLNFSETTLKNLY